jgi:transposase
LWTDKNRAKYDRDHLRYPSDLTDDEWAYVEPLIPPAKRGGGKRRTDMRAVMNGVMYILTFRRAAHCMTILRGGFATAR